MLSVDKVTYKYPGDSIETVKDLSFEVKKGEFVSLIGVSGCGKSTVFRLINRLLTPQSGSITVNGQDIGEQRRYCGYMPQNDLLFPWRTVAGNLMLPLEIAGEGNKQQRLEKAIAMLEEVGLKGSENKFPHELSGGMRQRAAFGRTALCGGELMLLDEPFSALDFLTRISMQEWLLEQWQHQKKTILFITHDVDEAIFLSDRILVVENTPISKLTEVEIPLPYPRSREMLNSPEIAKIRERLIKSLREQVAQ